MKFEKNELFQTLSRGDISPINRRELTSHLLSLYGIKEEKELRRSALFVDSLNLPNNLNNLKFIYFSQDMADRVTPDFAEKVLSLIKHNWIKTKTGIILLNNWLSAYFFNNGNTVSIALYQFAHAVDVAVIDKNIKKDELIGMTMVIMHKKDGSGSEFNFPLYILCLLFLMDYAEHEVKYVHSGNKKEKIGSRNEKVFNSSSLKVECIDSNWFTTIIRSDGFSVKGHFRMQPYGEKLKYRKLIWINDFEKTGYTKKAKMLNTQI